MDDDKLDEIRQARAKASAAQSAIDAAAAASESDKKTAKKKKFNRKFRPSKRYRACLATRGERIAKHPVREAIKLVKQQKAAKFDESMELHIRLGVDAKKSDQQVRGTFVFPHGIGKTKRVIVFAEGPAAEEAKANGAMEVGGEDLAKRITDGWLDFDVVIAHPGMMRVVGKLGKVLGPKKLMPNPKEGSVTPQIGQAVKEFAGGKAKYRVDDGGNLHAVFGKRSFPDEKLEENLMAFLEHVKTLKPSGAKGAFVLGGSIATTMGAGVTLDVGFLQAPV